jgi:hypothetical protein
MRLVTSGFIGSCLLQVAPVRSQFPYGKGETRDDHLYARIAPLDVKFQAASSGAAAKAILPRDRDSKHPPDGGRRCRPSYSTVALVRASELAITAARFDPRRRILLSCQRAGSRLGRR